VSVAARTAGRVQGGRAALARVQPRTASILAGLVAGSFLLRTVLGWMRATPTFFPDEYIYTELARSISEGGRPLIRGASASFPALLQPLLTAPAWLVEDVEVSYRLVQTAGALVMSLTAIPVFLLARRLGLGTYVALALAGLALVVPDMIYTAWILAEPFAYPLAISAFAVGTIALARPSPRVQLAFLALAGLATFARAQFVVVPICFLAAAAVIGLRERRLRAVAREQRLVLGLILVPVIGVLALGPGRALGFYEGVLDIDFASLEFARWIGVDAAFLVFASGVVLAPGALLGLWLALARPRSRDELAFGAFVLTLVPALLLEAAAYGLEGRVQERYFFYAVPLVGIAFALYASRGWPHWRAHALLAAGLVLLAARLPFAGYSAADGKTGSPVLYATARLEQAVGDVSLASLFIAGAVTALAAAVVLASRRPRLATPLTLGLAVAVCAAAYGAAMSVNLTTAETTRAAVLGSDPSFVDDSGVENAALLQSQASNRGHASEHLFWNRSVDSVYLLPGAERPDAFAVTRLTIAPDGTLLAAGKPVTRPLAADGFADTLRFRASEEVASSPVYRLMQTSGSQQLSLYAPGRYEDGWLGLAGSFRLWPETVDTGLAGTLSFRLTAPDEATARVTFTRRDGTVEEDVALAAGQKREVSFAVCASGPWRVDFQAEQTGGVGTRFVSVRASEPVYRPDPSACS
jgi:hypothetical protein